MFASLARRLTAWYVGVAVMLVVLLVGAVGVAALLLFANDVNEQIDALSRQVPDIESRAVADRDDESTAQALLVRRLSRPGLVVRVRLSPPQAPEHTPGRPPPADAFGVNRLGFAVASLLGIHRTRAQYFGGSVFISVDLDRVQRIFLLAVGILVATGALAGLAAWAIGRYITTQAMRPLYDVTHALVRFAGRDFRPDSINVAGRSEFDGLVRAYNAAAAQVSTAFTERAVAESQMRQFVADAGHELRTPLTIVLGYIDMLKRRAPDDERSRRIFETIAIEGTRMRTLIDNLVLLARLEGNDQRPIEPFELTPLLENDIVQTRSAIAGVRIDLDIRADATIIGERSEIYEAVANLVDNAIKYAPGSPVHIVVTRCGEMVEIAVSDVGPGIAAADQKLIFERFYRGSMRGDVEGSGLGLPIAKRAIERAGGSLVLTQSSQYGSTFTILLRADCVRDALPVP